MPVESEQIEQILQIRSYDVDLNGNLTLPSLCNYFQDIAWKHAEKLNIGYDFLKTINKFWVLSRLQVKIYQYPRWTDYVKLVTWPKGIDGLFALRDFIVIDKNGEKIIAATSSWLILDADKHRPQKIESDDHPRIQIYEKDAYIHSASKIPVLTNSTDNESFLVKFTDIDVNKHVNNVRYIEWAINTQTEKLRNGQVINEMVVNFMSEAAIDDKMIIYFNNSDLYNCSVSILNQSRNKESCRLQFLYK